MDQIPNTEETHNTREIEYFRWRDELMSLLKKIRENIAFSKSKLWDYTNDDLIEDLCAKIEQKAREEERERIIKLIDWRGKGFHSGSEVVAWIDEQLKTLNHSELDHLPDRPLNQERE